jgi:hypothetical protein
VTAIALFGSVALMSVPGRILSTPAIAASWLPGIRVRSLSSRETGAGSTPASSAKRVIDHPRVILSRLTA